MRFTQTSSQSKQATTVYIKNWYFGWHVPETIIRVKWLWWWLLERVSRNISFAAVCLLYTIINGYIIASFVQKKKSFEIVWSKKISFGVHTQPWNLSTCTQSYTFGLTPPLPICAYILCAWPPPTLPLKRSSYSILNLSVSNENLFESF